MKVISNSLHVIWVSHPNKKQTVFTSTASPVAHGKLTIHQHDKLKVQVAHDQGGILYSLHINFVMPTTSLLVWKLVDETNPGFNAWLGKSGHLIHHGNMWEV
jgi:hypothetical protein